MLPSPVFAATKHRRRSRLRQRFCPAVELVDAQHREVVLKALASAIVAMALGWVLPRMVAILVGRLIVQSNLHQRMDHRQRALQQLRQRQLR